MRNVNMHRHSHFSFNAENWSPTKIADALRAAGFEKAFDQINNSVCAGVWAI